MTFSFDSVVKLRVFLVLRICIVKWRKASARS